MVVRRQEEHSLGVFCLALPAVAVWMGSAFCAALGLAVLVLLALGLGEHGTVLALKTTARFSFLLFWPAYAGGAMTSLFGPAFEPLKRRGREFGLAFASAHLVHLGLVGWLTYIGAAPSRGVFVFFGIAALWIYVLASFSIPRLKKTLGTRSWLLMRVVGLNFLMCAFAKDFLAYPQFASLKYLAGYLPFAALSVVGPLLCFAAFTQRVAWLQRIYSRPAD